MDKKAEIRKRLFNSIINQNGASEFKSFAQNEATQRLQSVETIKKTLSTAEKRNGFNLNNQSTSKKKGKKESESSMESVKPKEANNQKSFFSQHTYQTSTSSSFFVPPEQPLGCFFDKVEEEHFRFLKNKPVVSHRPATLVLESKGKQHPNKLYRDREIGLSTEYQLHIKGLVAQA